MGSARVDRQPPDPRSLYVCDWGFPMGSITLDLADLEAAHEVTKKQLAEARRTAARPPIFGANPSGGLAPPVAGDSVESAPLLAAFRARGWTPDSPVSIDFPAFRTATWSGSVADLAVERRESAPLGKDRRYAYEAFPAVPEGPEVTSIQVLTESSRTLPLPADVVRAIDAV